MITNLLAVADFLVADVSTTVVVSIFRDNYVYYEPDAEDAHHGSERTTAGRKPPRLRPTNPDFSTSSSNCSYNLTVSFVLERLHGFSSMYRS